MGRAPRRGTKTAKAAPQSVPRAEPALGGADAELLRALDQTTRQALERMQVLSTSTTDLIARMTRDSQDLQVDAMERTAAAAAHLLGRTRSAVRTKTEGAAKPAKRPSKKKAPARRTPGPRRST